jgi:hypothetical protein
MYSPDRMAYYKPLYGANEPAISVDGFVHSVDLVISAKLFRLFHIWQAN